MEAKLVRAVIEVIVTMILVAGLPPDNRGAYPQEGTTEQNAAIVMGHTGTSYWGIKV